MEKYVLITGASTGLGKETAQLLAQKGFKVFAGVRKQQDKDYIESLNQNITAIFLDVTSQESIDKAFETVTSTTSNLFAIINNAGIAIAGPVEYIPVEMLKKQFDVNVFGAISVTQKFLPLLKDNTDSRIVNISSMASYGIFPFVSPYCASKRALDMFFNALLIECKMNNLKIISIKPGTVRTPIWDKSINESEKNLEHICAEGKEKYKKEFAFLAKNARKNNTKGLLPKDVSSLVYKVLTTQHPKLSYNVGKDSCFARFMSFLPQNLCNFLVKTGLKSRINS